MDDETDSHEKIADEYFDCSDKERAAFELGIKFGALFHQFIGTPVGKENKTSLEKAIKESIERQAYVRSAEVSIDLGEEESDEDPFSYTTLKGELIEAKILLEYNGVEAVGTVKYVEEIEYPLMFIERLNKDETD